jgi:hypothetical protein
MNKTKKSLLITSVVVLVVFITEAMIPTPIVRSIIAADSDCNAPSVTTGTDPETGQDVRVTRCEAASTAENDLRDFNIGRANRNGQSSSARGGDNAGGYPSSNGSRCAIAEQSSFDQAGCYP